MESAADQLLTDRPLVLPLHKWAGTAYDPNLWAVGPSDTDLVAEVDEAGTLSLPCVSDRLSEQLLEEVDTLEELRAAAAEPEPVVRFEPTHRM